MSTAFPDPITAALAVKQGVYDAAVAALSGQPDVDVSYGLRFPMVSRDALAVTTFEVTPAQDETDSYSPRRTRYDDVAIGVNVVSERAGFDESAEHAASAASGQILAALAGRLRDGDHTTLGGVAMWAFLRDARSEGATDEDDQGGGWRVIEIAATVVARVLIRS